MKQTNDKSKKTVNKGTYRHFKTAGHTGNLTAAAGDQQAATPSRKQALLRKAHIGNFFAGPHCFMGIVE